MVAEELTAIGEKFGDRRRCPHHPRRGGHVARGPHRRRGSGGEHHVRWLREVRCSPGRTRRKGRGGRGVRGAALREDDVVSHVLHTTAHAYLLVFTNRGKVYRIRAHQLPRKDRTAKGVLVQSVLPMDPDEVVEALIDTRDYESFRYLVTFTKKGQVKKTKFSEYDSRNQVLNAIRLTEGDEVVAVRRHQRGSGPDDVLQARPGHPLLGGGRPAARPRHPGCPRSEAAGGRRSGVGDGRRHRPGPVAAHLGRVRQADARRRVHPSEAGRSPG